VGSLDDEQNALVRTFLIADIRGYTRFTERHGDEASARLAAKFRDVVHEGVQLRGGQLIEIRGDEALAVFDSARQGIRAAVDLQNRFAEETDEDANCPMRVGIGIDSGEAIKLEDGSFRGAALNVAARLCGLAQGGEIIVSSPRRPRRPSST
jgi:class 3 adenylate cyclase